MKRLLLSTILALGFHAIILRADLSWLDLAPQPALKFSSMAIVLETAKSQSAGLETASLQTEHSAPPESAVHHKTAEKQPEPSTNNKPQKNSESVQNPAPIRPKKNLKALTLKRHTIKTRETIHPVSIEKRQSIVAAETKIGSPVNSSADSFDLPVSPHTALIQKTLSMPEGSSEPLTSTAAAPATDAQKILSNPVGVRIASPMYKQNVSPNYPLRARRMGYEGLVMLKVLVDENGRVDDLEVLESSGYAMLDRAAISSVQKWIFEPGTEGGKKKKMWVKIPIRFELE